MVSQSRQVGDSGFGQSTLLLGEKLVDDGEPLESHPRQSKTYIEYLLLKSESISDLRSGDRLVGVGRDSQLELYLDALVVQCGEASAFDMKRIWVCIRRLCSALDIGDALQEISQLVSEFSYRAHGPDQKVDSQPDDNRGPYRDKKRPVIVERGHLGLAGDE